MEVSGQLHAPALAAVKVRPVSTGQETGWAPEPVWTLCRREQSCSCRESNPGLPARSPELSHQLSHEGLGLIY
jgi:hypothetical protein